MTLTSIDKFLLQSDMIYHISNRCAFSFRTNTTLHVISLDIGPPAFEL